MLATECTTSLCCISKTAENEKIQTSLNLEIEVGRETELRETPGTQSPTYLMSDSVRWIMDLSGSEPVRGKSPVGSCRLPHQAPISGHKLAVDD